MVAIWIDESARFGLVDVLFAVWSIAEFVKHMTYSPDCENCLRGVAGGFGFSDMEWRTTMCCDVSIDRFYEIASCERATFSDSTRFIRGTSMGTRRL